MTIESNSQLRLAPAITAEDLAKYSQEIVPEIVAMWDAANRITARPYIKFPLQKALEDLERKILELKEPKHGYRL